MTEVSQPRYLAVKILTRIYSGAYSNLLLNRVFKKRLLKPTDARLLTRLVYGTLQHRITLRYDLRPFLKMSNQTVTWLKVLCEIAVYQMRYLNRVPNYAVFNESIQIAKVLGDSAQRRLVTGVLHNVIRKGFPGVNRIKDSIQRRAVKFSVPVWIVRELSKQLGDSKTKRILRAANQLPKQSIRVNRHLTTASKLIPQLKRSGYQIKASRLAQNGYVLHGPSILRSSFFKDGLLTVQDESAMLPVEMMQLQPDDLVLDACAAPGGKTCQIAEHLTNGRVVALDLYAERLALVRKNARRLKLGSRIQTYALDARRLNVRFKNRTFDRVLVDAPCSGLGLMQRKPEIRYFRKPADLKRLAKVQSEILSAVAPKLKPGGRLTYSTCTILNFENQNVIHWFLTHYPDFRLTPIEFKGRSRLMVKIYPDDFGSDGFFVCNLRKQG